MSIPSTHRALVVNAEQNGWEVKVQALPKFDDLLVRVHAIALNPTDWKQVKVLQPGHSTGSDYAGVVVKGAGPFKEGDRVAGWDWGGYLKQDNGAFAGTNTLVPSGLLLRYEIRRVCGGTAANCMAYP
jgi:NADPH:quinone reductase-like Zn-dependent oxidoreductase